MPQRKFQSNIHILLYGRQLTRYKWFQVEIETMLSFGVDPSRIVFANTCKHVSFIKYAAKNDVSLTTFDNENELHKIKEHFPTTR